MSKGVGFADAVLLACCVAGSFLCVPCLQAETQDHEIPVWEKIDGNAMDIGVGSGGRVHVVDQQQQVWQRAADDARWKKLPGAFVRIDTDADGHPWGVTATGELRVYQNSQWHLLEQQVFDVGIGADHVFVSYQNGALGRWNRERERFETIEGSGRYLDADYAGNLWVVSEQGDVRFRKNNQWYGSALDAVDVGLGASMVFFADPDAEGVPQAARSVSVGPGNVPWVVTRDGQIFARRSSPALVENRTGNEDPGVAAGPSTAEASAEQQETRKGSSEPVPPSRAALHFVRVKGQARQVAIGADGSVFALAANGNLMRYSNQRGQFLDFPGNFLSLAVDAQGHPWGINGRAEVLRHDGRDWQVLEGVNAQAIAISALDHVVLTDQQGQLWQWNEQLASFERIAQTSIGLTAVNHLAVDAQGTLWTLCSGGKIYRCVQGACEYVSGNQAEQIAIGPGNAVFIAAKNGYLYRYNDQAKRFEKISQPARQLAVGPGGKPWVVTGDNRVLASAFFERDESGDDAVARNTRSLEGSGSSSAITFTKHLKLETIPVTASGITLPIKDFGVSNNGRVVVLDSAGHVVEYSEKVKTFNKIIATHGPLITIQMEGDGTLWGVNSSEEVVRQVNGSFQKVPGLTSNTASPQPVYIGMGGGGHIFASSEDSTLFEYNKSSKRFERFPVQPPGLPRVHAVEPDGDPWVIDESTFKLYVFDGKKFVYKRSDVSFFHIGANGTAYILEDDVGTSQYPNNPVYRYNATNDSFDKTTVTAEGIQIAPDGRVWVFQNGGTIQRAR